MKSLEEMKEYGEVVNSSAEIPVNEQVLSYLADPEIGLHLAANLVRYPHVRTWLVTLEGEDLTGAIELILSSS